MEEVSTFATERLNRWADIILEILPKCSIKYQLSLFKSSELTKDLIDSCFEKSNRLVNYLDKIRLFMIEFKFEEEEFTELKNKFADFLEIHCEKVRQANQIKHEIILKTLLNN